MTAILRSLTGIGSSMLVIGALLAGCGQEPAPMSAGMSRAATKRQPARQHPQAMFSARNNVGAFDDDGDDGGGDAPPAADPPPASGGGGITPLPRPTAVPAWEEPARGGGDPTEVDDLYADLRSFGYSDTKKAMVQAIQAVTHKYPTRWDPHIDTQKHWQWWAVTIPEEYRKDHDTYTQDALRLAQYRFDVVYYIWVSKHRPSERKPGLLPPPINFDERIHVVKGIRNDDGWIVEISPAGTVVDFLQVPRDFLNDYNHFIQIPTALY